MSKPPQIGTKYMNKRGDMLELIEVSKCTSTINDRQCNTCNHTILHFEKIGQTCPVDAFGIPIWHRITETNKRW